MKLLIKFFFLEGFYYCVMNKIALWKSYMRSTMCIHHMEDYSVGNTYNLKSSKKDFRVIVRKCCYCDMIEVNLKNNKQ